MSTFVAVYRGRTVSESRLIAVSADPVLVAEVTTRILTERHGDESDPVVDCIERGRREALRLIKKEATDEPER